MGVIHRAGAAGGATPNRVAGKNVARGAGEGWRVRMSRTLRSPGLLLALAIVLAGGCASAPVARPVPVPVVPAPDLAAPAVALPNLVTMPLPATSGPSFRRAAAEAGDAISQAALADDYLRGTNGVPYNPVEALLWNRRAAGQKNVTAMISLAWQYANGAGVAQDFAAARNWFESAAQAAGPSGHYEVAGLYAAGRGVGAIDQASVVRHLRLAASDRYVPAMAMLGSMLFSGEGVKQDLAEALRWVRLAAEGGEVNAQLLLGRMHEEGAGTKVSYADARRWYGTAAGLGSREAQFRLGWLHESGLGGPQDFVQARTWYEQSARLGDIRAMSNLGAFYLNGTGVRQDYATALRWIRPAANAGYARALVQLGIAYNRGQGLGRDPVAALLCFEDAAAQGDGIGMYQLGLMYSAGDGVDRNVLLAIEWLEKSAALKHTAAATELEKLRAAPAR
jgi:TPR repeat protein